MARVLLVDDDREILKMASTLLAHAQFDVVCCLNAIEALEAVKTRRFDAIITDANMNPYSGYDLIRSIKALPDYDLIPIAMLTGRREKRDVERAVAVGAEGYIVKPLDPVGFIEKVQDLVARGEAHRLTAKFGEVTLNEVAACEVPMLLIGLTESGVQFDSDHRLLVGSQIRANSEVFTRMGIPSPMLKITSCTPGAGEDTFDIRASFVNLDEKQTQKLRQYIQTWAMQNKRPARAS